MMTPSIHAVMKKYLSILFSIVFFIGVVLGAPGDQEATNSTATYKESWDSKEKAFVWEVNGVLYKRLKKQVDNTDADFYALTQTLTADNNRRVVVAKDNRNFKFATNTAPFAIIQGFIPENFLEKVDKADPDSIKNLNPKGTTIRNIVNTMLYQSWEYMVEELNKNNEIYEIEDPRWDNRRNLMRKIWEYRQWHHEYILRLTKANLNTTASTANLYDSGFERLTEWSAAGSTTLTSDIDVNLKGTNTEAAVDKFNELFTNDGWDYEAGVVYDVNVYAIDYLHKEATFGSGMVIKDTTSPGLTVITDLHGNTLKRVDTSVSPEVTTINNTAFGTGFSGKEGARTNNIVGGFEKDLNGNYTNAAIAGIDTANQNIWSHVKARLYMTEAEFNLYWTATTLDNQLKTEVLSRYNTFRNDLTGAMALYTVPATAFVEAPDANLTGIQQLNAYAERLLTEGRVPAPDTTSHEFQAKAADVLMEASNRLYEDKLVTVYNERVALKTLVTEYFGLVNAGAPDATAISNKNQAIENKLVDIRNLVSEAALFANEAYLTDGAVNLVVVGIQGNAPLTGTNSESLNSVVENMADAIKEIVRHGIDPTFNGGNLANPEKLGEAAFKSGKYIYRMANAALNMGYVSGDIIRLSIIGKDISDDIKKSKADPVLQLQLSAEEITKYYTTTTTPAQLSTLIRTAATEVIKWAYDTTNRPVGFTSSLSAPIRLSSTQEFYNASSNLKESWDTELKAFVWEDGNTRYKRINGADTRKIPEDLKPNEFVSVSSSDDNRFFKFESNTAEFSVVQNTTPAGFLTALDNADVDAVKNINPKGKALRDMIQNQLYQSWEYMTHELNKDGTVAGGKQVNRRNFLQKIWEYRQWHHDYMLYKSMDDLNEFSSTPGLYDSGEKRLTEWSAAGSTTLTSDIDVNLKGTDTEAAVLEFNFQFEEDGWKYEPGVVYDVNVYAVDYLHKEATFGSGMVVKQESNGTKKTFDLHSNLLKNVDTTKVPDVTLQNFTSFGTGIAGKEAARKGRIVGGFDGTNQNFIDQDVANQEIWSLVKLRLYMTAAEFDTFWTNSTLNNQLKPTVINRYNSFRNELTNEMLLLKELDNYNENPDNTLTGIQQLNEYAKDVIREVTEPDPVDTDPEFEADAAELLMAASNLIYETKLVVIHQERDALKDLVSQYDRLTNPTATLNREIEEQLVKVRNLVSEATLFANEAYVTDGAVNLVVVGIQGGVPLTATNYESLNSAVENMADAVKEIVRHGYDESFNNNDKLANPNKLGEAAFKAGKYMYRLADAALNMGYNSADVAKLYVVGNEISNFIKKTVAEPEKQYDLSAREIISFYFGTTTPTALKAKVIEIGTAVVTWSRTAAWNNNYGAQLSARVSPTGEQESYNDTSNYLESWNPGDDMTKVEAFVWEYQGKLYRRREKFDTTKIPEDIPMNRWEDITNLPDNRNFKFPNPVPGALTWQYGETPDEFLARLDDDNQVNVNAVAGLNPKGKAIRDIIQNVMYESWEYMVHKLNTGEDDGKRKILLRKIWEYRQWHHDYMLLRAKRSLNAVDSSVAANGTLLFDSGQKRLTKWSAAGSTTLTSDIDVNLKGTDTEAAVKEYNALYKLEDWKYEPGVVYDVNVYALDFMHAEANLGSGMVVKTNAALPYDVFDLHGNLLKSKDVNDNTTQNFTAKGTGIHGKEAGRFGWLQGGFYQTNNIDIANQHVWTHVKARVYMTSAEFNTYASAYPNGIGIDQGVWSGDGSNYRVGNAGGSLKDEALARYNAFFNELAAKMLKIAGKDANAYPVNNVTGLANLTGIQQLNRYAEEVIKLGKNPDPEVDNIYKFEGDAADLLMAASNRIYEEKLEAIHAKRVLLKTDVTAYDNDGTTPPNQNGSNVALEDKLEELRNLVSEAALFANEAYVTDGAVNHTVVGLQMKAPIRITNAEGCDAIVENMADALKEATRHGGDDLTSIAGLGEAAFKAGKYMFRLADAAINMGYVAPDMIALYRAGSEISTNIKKNEDLSASEQYRDSAIEINVYLTVVTPAELKAKIVAIVTEFMNWKKTFNNNAGIVATDRSDEVGSAKQTILANEEALDQSIVGNPKGFLNARHEQESNQILINIEHVPNVPYSPETGNLIVRAPMDVQLGIDQLNLQNVAPNPNPEPVRPVLVGPLPPRPQQVAAPNVGNGNQVNAPVPQQPQQPQLQPVVNRISTWEERDIQSRLSRFQRYAQEIRLKRAKVIRGLNQQQDARMIELRRLEDRLILLKGNDYLLSLKKSKRLKELQKLESALDKVNQKLLRN